MSDEQKKSESSGRRRRYVRSHTRRRREPKLSAAAQIALANRKKLDEFLSDEPKRRASRRASSVGRKRALPVDPVVRAFQELVLSGKQIKKRDFDPTVEWDKFITSYSRRFLSKYSFQVVEGENDAGQESTTC